MVGQSVAVCGTACPNVTTACQSPGGKEVSVSAAASRPTEMAAGPAVLSWAER